MKNTALAGTALAGTASWESYIGSDRIDIKVYVGVRQDIRRCVPDAGFSMLVFMGYEQHFANAFLLFRNVGAFNYRAMRSWWVSI